MSGPFYRLRIHPRLFAGMTEMQRMNRKVDGYLRRAEKWQKEFERLRTIALGCELTEELKWGQPCYTLQNKNIVIIQGFKEYCAFLFFKGALLKDTEGLLVKPGENTQASRQIRFTNVREIVRLERVLTAYIHEAIDVQKAGLKVKLRKTADLEMPEEFQTKLEESPALKKAFYTLTPGRQRAYLLHFSQAKQAKTRESRIAKCRGQILKGKGLHD
ncbi:MAG TPA: YdeI/OmpD-associated family protein [Pirellulales bacterium]|nr:YdeI/OmpD-associated family protein [Pirellulales bacterium]